MKAKYTTLKGHQYRTFNGLRITNMEDRSVKLKLEPGDAVVEHTSRKCVDAGQAVDSNDTRRENE